MKYKLKGQPAPTHYQDDITRMLWAIGADDTHAHREMLSQAWEQFSMWMRDERHIGNGAWHSLAGMSDAQVKDVLLKYVEIYE